MKLDVEKFGVTEEGEEVSLFVMTNAAGHSVSVMNWGASLVDVKVADKDGKVQNVNSRFEKCEQYYPKHSFFGSIVGRFCNRIAEGKFVIDGTTYELPKNSGGKHSIHGGVKNFAFRFWNAKSYEDEKGGKIGVRFTRTSPDGEEQYPGTLTTTVDYSWNNSNELTCDISATTDKATHVNLTNHAYWNLGGAGSGPVYDHVATIQADSTLDVDKDLIPSGKFNSVNDTAFDFREPKRIGERIDTLTATNGYDHCYVLHGESGKMRKVAEVVDPKSGRKMEIETTQPGIQIFTANHLVGDERSAGVVKHGAFCLETQHFPDSPSHASFPSTLLRPGEKLHESTTWRFSIAT